MTLSHQQSVWSTWGKKPERACVERPVTNPAKVSWGEKKGYRFWRQISLLVLEKFFCTECSWGVTRQSPSYLENPRNLSKTPLLEESFGLTTRWGLFQYRSLPVQAEGNHATNSTWNCRPLYMQGIPAEQLRWDWPFETSPTGASRQYALASRQQAHRRYLCKGSASCGEVQKVSEMGAARHHAETRRNLGIWCNCSPPKERWEKQLFLLYHQATSFVDNPKRNEFASLEKTLSKELEREGGQEGNSVAGVWIKCRMAIRIQKMDEMHWEDGQQPGGGEQGGEGRPSYLKGVPNSSSVRAAF